MRSKLVFEYDRFTKKGLIKTDKTEIKINLQKKECTKTSGGAGYGLHLI